MQDGDPGTHRRTHPHDLAAESFSGHSRRWPHMNVTGDDKNKLVVWAMMPQAGCDCRRWKKWTRNFTVACFFLAGGIEYSVIFPTMFDYVESLNGEEWLYGLCLAAFSISNLFCSPVFGFMFDRTHRTKLIVLFANLFEIGGDYAAVHYLGNFLYFAAESKFVLLGSRFIVGVGAGAGAAIFGELARTSTNKERTAVFSIFMSMRQIGLVIGPAFNLFLSKTDDWGWHIGPFQVTRLTSPGVFMMLIWIIVEAMFLLMFYELPPINQNEEKEDVKDDVKNEGENSSTSEERSLQQSDIDVKMDSDGLSISQTQSTKDVFVNSRQNCNLRDEDTKVNERTPLLPSESPCSINKPADDYGPHSKDDKMSVAMKLTKLQRVQKRVLWLLSEFMREEIVVLLAIIFITVYNQTSIETMLVPMAEDLLQWDEEEISFFYSGAGLEIIISFIVVTVASKKVEDRWQILVGVILELFAFSWLLGFTGKATSETPGMLWKFLCGAIPGIFGLPLFMVTGASLYSKMIPMHIQGTGQGIRRSVFSIAAILGPLWAGGALAFNGYFILLGVPLGLVVFIMVLILLSFTKLKEPRNRDAVSKSVAQT